VVTSIRVYAALGTSPCTKTWHCRPLVQDRGRRTSTIPFHSGDLRAHGRKSKLLELMLKSPPKNIDVMLMEGSSLGGLAL
jgi:hypothetical protein